MLIVESIKSNINKIDFQLKELFENVNIKEKSDRSGNFFEIVTDSSFFFEDYSWKRAGVKVKIYKQDLINESNIKWFYQIDTLDESSDWVERSSSTSDIGRDIYNTIILKQMSNDYFSKLETIVESINESSSSISDSNIEAKIESVLFKYGIKINNKTHKNDVVLENNQFMSKKPDQKIKFSHKSEIKISERFQIELDIKSMPGINYVLFKDNEIEVDYTPES